MPNDPTDIPRGLVFSSLRNSPGQRRRTLVFVAVVALAGLALIWPVYPSVASIQPYILDLPFSLAWVVGWLGIVFVALVLLYRADELEPDS